MLERIVGRSAPPEVDTYAIGLVDWLVRAGRREQARRELEALLARHPMHGGALERLASMAVDEGAWDRAAEIHGRLVRALDDPQGTADRARVSRVVSGLVDACERAGRPADVRESLEIALRVLSESSDVALLLRAATVLVERCGQPASALPAIERARAAHPESIEAALLWAKLEATSGRSADALAALQDVAQRNRGKRAPSLAGVYLAIGKAHLAADELVEALEALKAGFAIDWHHGELAMLVGLVALDLGEDKLAERALLAVAMAAPRKEVASSGVAPAEKVDAFYHLAMIASSQGDLVKARRWVTKAASEDPGHAGARTLLEELDSRAPGQSSGRSTAPRTPRPA
jgi:tetratricopeptide (TPR) repeat protein